MSFSNSESFFPSSSIAFVAAVSLVGNVTLRRVGEYSFEIFPFDRGIELWKQYQSDELVFSARALSDQIRYIKKLPLESVTEYA